MQSPTLVFDHVAGKTMMVVPGATDKRLADVIVSKGVVATSGRPSAK